MGWLATLFGFKPSEGIRLDFEAAWEVSPPKDISVFIRRLAEIMPAGAMVYLESTAVPPHVNRILEAMECKSQVQVARGTIWPKQRCFHIPMTQENLNTIADLLEKNAPPEICDHFHIYAGQTVLLEWHDAFYKNPFFTDGQISEEKLKCFCNSVGSSYRKASSNS